jgi:hypothetical protein
MMVKSNSSSQTSLSIISYLGIPIRSNLDASITQQYAALIKSLSDKARSTIREIDPTNELVFFRMRTKKHEILVAPGLLKIGKFLFLIFFFV